MINVDIFRCNSQTKCSINATTTIFGNPCNNTYKYLSVDYECQNGKKVMSINNRHAGGAKSSRNEGKKLNIAVQLMVFFFCFQNLDVHNVSEIYHSPVKLVSKLV